MIVKCIDTVAPRREIKLQNKWQGKQWFSEEIRQRQQDETYKVARTSRSTSDWELFRQLRNRGVDICTKAKKSYLKNKLDSNKKDSKQMWGTLKEMLKGNSFRDNVYKEVQCGDEILSDMKKMANVFNKYFIDSISAFGENDFIIDLDKDIKRHGSVSRQV